MTDDKWNKVGWGLTIFMSLAFFASAFFKYFPPADAAENTAKMGLSPDFISTIGALEILGAVLFLVPKTSFVGSILLTGYMGGAICTHLRIGEPVYVQVLFPILVWVAYGLRNPKTIRTAFGN